MQTMCVLLLLLLLLLYLSCSVFLVFEYCEHDLGRVLDTHPHAFSGAQSNILQQVTLILLMHPPLLLQV
jgi:hypothetical protein